MLGKLCKTPENKWVVIYEFGEQQVGYLRLHPESLHVVEQNKTNFDGKDIEFEIRATEDKRSFNGAVSCAKINLQKLLDNESRN